MYLKNILNMPDSRLVKIVYNEQKRLGMTKCWCKGAVIFKAGYRVEEFSEGYQIFRSCYIGVSNILEKIVKYLMGCEIFGIYFGLK